MPDFVSASSNTARAARTYVRRAHAYVVFILLILTMVTPFGSAIVAAVTHLGASIVFLAGSILAIAISGRIVALAVRAGRTMPMWVVALLIAIVCIAGTVLVMRWLDKGKQRRKAVATLRPA